MVALISDSCSSDEDSEIIEKLHPKHVCYIGAGYVGGLSAIVMAHYNPQIEFIASDINAELIKAWNSDKLPIFEPGLEELLFTDNFQDKIGNSASNIIRNGCSDGSRKRLRCLPNLKFSCDVHRAIAKSQVIFLCVNTPLDVNGQSLNVLGLKKAIASIAVASDDPKIIVEKSTVPCGMAEQIKRELEASARPGASFKVLSNPEFLAQGSAIENLLNPSRVVIGWPPCGYDDSAVQTLIELYRSNVPLERIVTMNSWSSELAKLASNAFVAQRISSINSLSAICEATAADVEDVSRVIGLDRRVGSECLKAGLGFGGSCLEKDVSCLAYFAHALGLHEVAQYWEQVNMINRYQNARIPVRVLDHLHGGFGKKIAILGFAFKKNTVDTRNSTAKSIVYDFAKHGAVVSIHDPYVTKEQIVKSLWECDARLPERVVLSNSAYEACHGANAVFLHTDWDLFTDLRELNWKKISDSMKAPKLFLRGRGHMEGHNLERLGFLVLRIGQSSSSEQQGSSSHG